MAKRIALVISAILAIYLLFAASRGLDLIRVDDPAVKILGVAVLILPLLGAVLLVREIRFGRRSYDMGQKIEVTYLPTIELSDDEKIVFLDNAIEKAKSEMTSWQAWYSVAIAYDLTGERKLAREAMRYSVDLYQEANPK